jgi:preprotein translocase subunit SecE
MKTIADRGRGVGSIFQELFRFGLYKRSQGRMARQATFGALALIVSVGAWRLYEFFSTSDSDLTRYFLPLVVLLVGLWTSFRLVHMPSFAEFLISVENEMAKVSWPARGELFRASVVVMLVIFVMAFLLYGFDIMWEIPLRWLLKK